MTIRISAEHFVAGVVLEEDRCTSAAPIIKYMIGWSKEQIIQYCKEKDWKYEII